MRSLLSPPAELWSLAALLAHHIQNNFQKDSLLGVLSWSSDWPSLDHVPMKGVLDPL